MPSKIDRDFVIGAFDSCVFPNGAPTLETAWLGIYQVLIWYDEAFIHIKESNDLRNSKVWQQRSRQAEKFNSDAIGVNSDELPNMVDRMMRLDRWKSVAQRNNPLGNGLRILLAEILKRWGSPALSYPEEADATKYYPGIQMPGRSTNPKMDVAAVHNGRIQGIFSCKWSYRHDRISDPTNECVQYKSAASQQQFYGLKYYVVTSEFYSRRIEKVLNQPCVNALVHVHLPLALHLADDSDREKMQSEQKSGKLLDLTDLLRMTNDWAL